jgi:raffinose/stachyose/melibiose transport system permease protein
MTRKSIFLSNIIAILLNLIALIPFYFLLVTALSTPNWQNILIPEFHFQNFTDAWEKSQLGNALFNSLIITFFSLVLIVLISGSAGYAFARVKNIFHKVSYNAFLFSMMVPAIINTVPLYILMKQIKGINTHWAMVLLLTTGSIPFAVFLYTSFIETMSKEIEDSALIDGCSKFTTFWRVVFPLLKPVTSSVIILNAVSIWNNYGTAVFFLQKQAMRTVPLAISSFVQTYGANWNLMASAAFIGLLPAVIIFLSFQKYFIKGIAAGSVKG